MKINLEIDLEKPDNNGAYELECALRGSDFRAVISDLGEEIRLKLKYDDLGGGLNGDFKTPREALEWVQRRIHELLIERFVPDI